MNAKDKLTALHLLDLISDFELACLLKSHCGRAPNRIVKPKTGFNLYKFSDSVCKKLFRFSKSEILRLVSCLNLSCKIKSQRRYIFSGVEGLCILLHRLAYPCRLHSLGRIFNRHPVALSNIINWMLAYIDRNCGHLLETFDHGWLSRYKLFEFSNAVDRAGSLVPYIWGFIDGTARPICRPVRFQRQYYSGHKRIHCVKYVAIMCPNGIIARLNGPYIGRRHDSFLLDLSKIVPDIRHCEKFRMSNENFRLFGDTGYVNTKYILTNFRNPTAGSLESEFNRRMAQIRVVVEWGFGRVSTLFAFIDFKKNQKLLLQPLGKYYRVATILTNCYICLNGGQVGAYFQLQPPSLEDYLVVNSPETID